MSFKSLIGKDDKRVNYSSQQNAKCVKGGSLSTGQKYGRKGYAEAPICFKHRKSLHI